MTNADATDRTIAALVAAGRLAEDEHAAIIQTARSLARAVDADLGNASLWREFQKATDVVMTTGADDGSQGDEVQLILATIRGGASVVNATHAEPSDARPRGGTAG